MTTAVPLSSLLDHFGLTPMAFSRQANIAHTTVRRMLETQAVVIEGVIYTPHQGRPTSQKHGGMDTATIKNLTAAYRKGRTVTLKTKGETS